MELLMRRFGAAPRDVTQGPSGSSPAAGSFASMRESAPYMAQTVGRQALDFTPAGTPLAVKDGVQDARQGNWGSAGWNVASALPVAGPLGKLAKKAGKIADWKWRPFKDVAEEVSIDALPKHVEDFGAFMQEQASRASRNELGPRDMLKANAITQASIQRTGRDADALRAAGMVLPDDVTGMVRPEGAMAEWLMTPAGRRYLDQAERGVIDRDAIEEIVSQFKSFGKDNSLRKSLVDNVEIGKMGPEMNTVVNQAVRGNRGDARQQMAGVIENVSGVADAKQGFLGSMLGYGIDPTFDARQIRLHTGAGGDEAKKFISRKGGGAAAVARLADRQRRMGISVPNDLKPFDQHLMHHAVWDKVGNQKTTHADLIKAMRLAGLGAVGIPVLNRLGARQEGDEGYEL
jgi:hypothetical protein